jgi:hypothetical protein
LSDTNVGLKDTFQAKATLQSIIDNYKADDDILPTAKEKLDKLSGRKTKAPAASTKETTQPDTTNKQ